MGRMPKPRQIDTRKVWDIRALDLCFERLPGEDAGKSLMGGRMMLVSDMPKNSALPYVKRYRDGSGKLRH